MMHGSMNIKLTANYIS